MRPPAPASPRERRGLAGPAPALLSAAALAALAGLFPACTESEWRGRDPIEVRGAPVDTLEFLPRGSRFVLLDSLTGVRAGGLRLGYECTEILAFGLEKRASPVAGYAIRLDYRLPAGPDCPLERGARDDTLLVRFAAGDAPAVRLVDSAGTVLDSAQAVRGRIFRDSLELKAKALSAFNSRFFFQDDTTGPAGRVLKADSLAPCEALNHAEYERKSDSLRVVRYSWISKDPASADDSCGGPDHAESLVPVTR